MREWHVSINGEQTDGLYTADEIRLLPEFPHAVLIWKAGMAEWSRPGDSEDFRATLPAEDEVPDDIAPPVDFVPWIAGAVFLFVASALMSYHVYSKLDPQERPSAAVHSKEHRGMNSRSR